MSAVFRVSFPYLLAFLLTVVCAVSGCNHSDPDKPAPVAPGVTFKRDRTNGVQLIEVDLSVAKVRPQIVTSGVERRSDGIVGDCFTVREWLEKHNAVAGVNGGYFGATFDQVGRRKAINGLTVVEGKVLVPAGFIMSTRNKGEKFLRSAIGFTKNGTPDIAWAASSSKNALRRYESPVNPHASASWPVVSALGCGPRLFVNGVKRITDVEERLVHNKSAARTFVAYDTDSEGRPRHFVMGRSDSQTFAQTADFLQDYFQKAYQSRPHDALCLDGGSSSQIVYKNANGSIEDAEPTGVLVPTALVLVPVKSTGSGKTLIPNPHQLPKRGRVQNVGFHPRGFMSVALLF